MNAQSWSILYSPGMPSALNVALVLTIAVTIHPHQAVDHRDAGRRCRTRKEGGLMTNEQDPISSPPPPARHHRRRGKRTTTFPYASATSGTNARDEIAKILRQFGCESIGIMDEYETDEVLLYFKHRGRQVRLRASAKGVELPAS
jgi:hypothetical protein